MKEVLISDVTCIASNRNKGWWMESSLKNEVIEYKNQKELKDKISELLKEKDYALNKKIKFQNMYNDNREGVAGYVCNIMVDVESDYRWKRGYFELWVGLVNINTKDGITI